MIVVFLARGVFAVIKNTWSSMEGGAIGSAMTLAELPPVALSERTRGRLS